MRAGLSSQPGVMDVLGGGGPAAEAGCNGYDEGLADATDYNSNIECE